MPALARTPFVAVLLLSSALAAVFGSDVAGAGGGFCHQAPSPAEASGAVVEMRHSCFAPMVLRIDPGTEVTFSNTDPMVHYVTGSANAWGSKYNEEGIEPGRKLVATFTDAGTYGYSCSLHPGMTGVVVVGDGTFAGSPTSPDSQLVFARVPVAPADELPADPPQAVVSARDAGSSTTESLLLAAMGAAGGAVLVAVAMAVRRR